MSSITKDFSLNLDNDKKLDDLTLEVRTTPNDNGEIQIKAFVNSTQDAYLDETKRGYAQKITQTPMSRSFGSGVFSIHSVSIEDDAIVLSGKTADGKTSRYYADLERILPPKEGQTSIDETKALNRESARNAGVLGALKQGSELDAVFGASLESNPEGLKSLIGADKTRIGSGGLGARGSGLGAGGSAEGLGGLGTKGRGSGKSGYGAGGGNFGKPLNEPSKAPDKAPALDKSIVDATIKKHMNGIRYCYQKQLNTNPDLSGSVVVQFTINHLGQVQDAGIKKSTWNNKEVGELVNSDLISKFSELQFDKPKGGGIVVVAYPFIFDAQ